MVFVHLTWRGNININSILCLVRQLETTDKTLSRIVKKQWRKRDVRYKQRERESIIWEFRKRHPSPNISMEVSVNWFRQGKFKSLHRLSGLQWHPHNDHHAGWSLPLGVFSWPQGLQPFPRLLPVARGPDRPVAHTHNIMYAHKWICICILSMLQCLLPLLVKTFLVNICMCIFFQRV